MISYLPQAHPKENPFGEIVVWSHNILHKKKQQLVKKINNSLLCCISHLYSKEEKKKSTKEQNFSQTKVYLGLQALQMKNDKA